MIPFMLLMACGDKVHIPETIAAPDVNGKASFVVMIPVRDDAAAYDVTDYDQDYILSTKTCENGFQHTKIEYAALSDDGISTKNITFYCL